MRKRQVLAFLMAMSVLVSTVFPSAAAGLDDPGGTGSLPQSGPEEVPDGGSDTEDEQTPKADPEETKEPAEGGETPKPDSEETKEPGEGGETPKPDSE